MKYFAGFWLFAAVFLFSVSAIFAQNDAPISLKGLQNRIEIRRDERGIPFIQAQNDDDLYFAQGFATAQDRLWQMDLLRRVAGGETAEIFGTPALERDKYWRKYGFRQIAEASLDTVSGSSRAALESYAKGVNAYIAALDEKNLPLEFQLLRYRPQAWKASDSIIIGKILAEGLSSTWNSDLFRSTLGNLPPQVREKLLDASAPEDVFLYGKKTKRRASHKTPQKKLNLTEFDLQNLSTIAETRRESLESIGFYAENSLASNNFVVSGKHTADGAPLLANDPHLPVNAPSIWHLVHLSSGKMRVAGVTFPGVPGVVLGHNQFIAWGATNVGPDVQDLYIETFTKDKPTQYKTPNGFADAQIRREEIRFRQNPLDPNSLKTEILEVYETRNGKVVYETEGRKYALRWTAFDPKNNEIEAFLNINRATNWTEFQNALRTYGGATQNFVYADTKGNIGWYAAGKIPLRKTGDGSLPYDGAGDEGAWMGTIPFEELPHLFNPENGIIVTANQRTVDADYKYASFIRDYAAPYRARRILSLLEAKPKLTSEDFMRIQHDIYSIPLADFAAKMAQSNAVSSETRALFKMWDGKMSADSKAALVALEMFTALRRTVLNPIAGTNFENQFRSNANIFIKDLVEKKSKEFLPKPFADFDALFADAEKQALENLTKRFGADESKWIWGASAPIKFPHPLAVVPLFGAPFDIKSLPRIGNGDTPNVGANVSMRFVAAPADWDKTRHQITPGESGNPNSPHWRDQTDGWYQGNSSVFVFSTEKVRQINNLQVFVP